jgi:ribosomal protein S27AE
MYRYNKVELVGEGSIMVTEKIAINPNERCPKCGAYLAQESMS